MDFRAILNRMQAHADTGRARQMSAYMRDRFAYLGIQAPLRKQILKPFLHDAKRTHDLDWGFVEACWASPFREMQYVAVEYLQAVKQRLTPSDIPRLKQLICTQSWWDTIDSLDRIVGAIALRYPDVNAVLLAWSVDENIWLRRVAIDHQLLRKEKTDTDLLEQILVNNLGQKEFFINKAIGWALRDYSKTNPEWVRAFIERHRPQMAPLTIREAEKYL